MNSRSNPPSSNRPMPIRDDRTVPNLEPLWDVPEPMLEPTLGPPRKKPGQIDEDSDVATEKLARGISNISQPANVGARVDTNAHTDAKDPVLVTSQEAARLKKASEKAAMPGHDLRDF